MMTTVRLMRCHTSHFLGDKYIAAGTMLPEGDPDIGEGTFFSVYEIEAPAPKTSRRSTK